MNSEKTTEEMLQEKGLNAPRLNPGMIDDAIAGDFYHRFGGTTVTVCRLKLKNGFSVIGESAAASLDNFDEDIGRKIAYDNAREKIWVLMGFLLVNTLSETPFILQEPNHSPEV